MPFKKIPPLYHVWMSMRDRCRNPNNRQWNDYGGRGIAICERWNSYHTFAADMGERPDGCSLDRIDNDGNYSPENCRWATRKEQQRNQRRAVYVKIEGKTYRAIELAEQYGIDRLTLCERVKRGLPFDKVVSKENLRDLSGLALGGAAFGRKQKAKTHCPHGHEFTPENTYLSKEGWRSCRACHRAKAARLRDKRRR